MDRRQSILRRHSPSRTFLPKASSIFVPLAAALPDRPPKTKRIQIAHGPFVCDTPKMMIAESFFRVEGRDATKFSMPFSSSTWHSDVIGACRP